ncbi:MAG TPA: carboxypeptidase, partial [Saprospiraceae bacterium]|nr:carboxypeptidase [Saprospiraceae bacterium]
MAKMYYILIFLSLGTIMLGQSKAEDKGKPRDEKPGKYDRSLDFDYKVEKNIQSVINGKNVPYKVTAATLPVWDEEGKAMAG